MLENQGSVNDLVEYAHTYSFTLTEAEREAYTGSTWIVRETKVAETEVGQAIKNSHGGEWPEIFIQHKNTQKCRRG